MTLPLRKIAIFSLLLALVAWGAVGVYLLYTEKVQPRKEPAADISEDIRQQVLTSLEEDLEFCKIVKDSIVSDKGEFWLICNGRPFYAVYENGKVNYELNGWSFLKNQPEILKELQDNHCRLYQATDGKTLSFICEDEKVRQYTFSVPDFKLTSLGDGPFVEKVFYQDWKSTELPCELVDYNKINLGEEPFIRFNMKCQEYDSVMFFSLDRLYFTLPVVVGEGLSDREKVQQSIGLLGLGDCGIRMLPEIGREMIVASLDCGKEKSFMVSYNLEAERGSVLVEKDKFTTTVTFVGKYILPFLEEKKLKPVGSSQNELYDYYYYQTGNRIVVSQGIKGGEFLSLIHLKTEGFQ